MGGNHDDGASRKRVRWISVRAGGALVIVLALALLPYRAIDSDALAMLERLKTDLSDARTQLGELNEENARLRRDINALRSDPRAIEEFARRDLGMTRPGEILIRLEGER